MDHLRTFVASGYHGERQHSLCTGHLLDGVAWIVLNMLLAVGDRGVQRSMFAADQLRMSASRASHCTIFVEAFLMGSRFLLLRWAGR